MIAETLRENLILIASAYAKATRTTLSYVSKRFYGKTAFLADFKRGDCSISIDKYDQIVTAIQDDWPPKAQWPFLRSVIIPSPARVR
jgi:hypothetical protein